MKYPIRLARKEDYDKIAQLYEKAFDYGEGFVKYYYKGFSEYLSLFVNENNAFVIEDGDTICGGALVYEIPDMFSGRSLYIDFLAVLPDYQNKGMGRSLIEYILTRLSKEVLQKSLFVLHVIKMHI